MVNKQLEIGKRYSAIPRKMSYFNMRHKIPLENGNFIVTIINTVEDELGKDWYNKLTTLVSTFIIRLELSNTRSWIDHKINKEKEQCYIVSIENNKNEVMYEIMLDSEIIRIKRK